MKDDPLLSFDFSFRVTMQITRFASNGGDGHGTMARPSRPQKFLEYGGI
jgi:hypothetical protein